MMLSRKVVCHFAWSLSFLLLVSISSSFAQDCTCATTTNTLTILNGENQIVNAYYPANASALSGANTISLDAEQAGGSNGTIEVGDILLVIQMQGAEINTSLPDFTTNGDYADGSGGNDRSGIVETEDFIAGQYEYIIANSAVGSGGGTLTLKTALQNSYIHQVTASNFSTTQGRQTFQVVRVGNFSTVDIQAGGTVTGLPWNGSSGGVVAVDALTSMVINGNINANFLGFRGGLRRTSDSGGGDATTSPFASQTGLRGEGIAGTPLRVFGYNGAPLLGGTLAATVLSETGYPGGEDTTTPNPRAGNPNNVIYNSYRGAGAPGNAGGAGRGDASGGGGSNGGIGGAGGFPGGAEEQGLGGAELDLELASRAFLGGGGGSGGFDNDTGFTEAVASGQPGGGIILIRANAISGAGGITNNGESGGNQTTEGVGGGGAGGTVILVTDTEDLSSLTITAEGGDGGTTDNVADGGGGGGSGGNILLVRRGGIFSMIPTVSVDGGVGGVSAGGGSLSGTAGDGGFETTSIPPPATLDCPLINLPDASPGGVLDDLILWLDAGENVTFDGTNETTQWQGLSSNGFILRNDIFGSAEGTPDYNGGSGTSFNFNPFISFNNEGALNDFLGFANFTNFPTDNLTLFVVLNTNNTVGTQTAVSYFDGAENDLNLDLVSGTNVARQNISGNNTDGTSAIRDGFTRIVTTDYQNLGGASDQARVFVNNLLETTGNFDGGQLTQGGQIVLGQELDNSTDGGFNTAEAFVGDIAEVILYFNDPLTDTERQMVSSYLAIKYGVTMDQSTDQDYLNSIGESIYPTQSEGALYAAYDNDIAGIGRDDGAALDQRQSASINADVLLTGSINSFPSDRQFLVWGNDSGTLEFSNNDVAADVTSRLQRSWRASVTNGISNVSLSFDFTGGVAVSNVPAATANMVLLVDDDGTFATGVTQQVIAASWNGNVATFDNVTLTDNAVFTVAVLPDSPGGVAAGLTLWLRADAGTNTIVNGQEVTTWTDQSSIGSNLTSTAITPPGGENGPNFNTAGTNFNGNPSLTFVDDHLSIAAYAFPADNITLFSVQTTTDLDFGGVFSYQINGDEYVVAQLSNLDIDVQGNAQGIGLNIADGEPHILTSDFDDPSENGNVFSDGLLSGAGPTYVSGEGTDPTFQTGGLLTLGQETDNVTDGGFGATENFEGDIAEIILFSGVLSAADRNKVESYLALKYGITLDQSTNQDYVASNGVAVFPATSSLPDYITYANDIAGIGRDDQSTLNQLSSQSENNDAIVNMSIGSLASNGQFLVWGNDNDNNGLGSTAGTFEEVMTDVPTNIVTRLDREWRVANTNSTPGVTVTFDLSSIGISVTGTTAEDFTLLIDQDGDFTDGFVRSIEATSFAGNLVTFSNVTFANNDIFTLGTSVVPENPGGITATTVLWLRADRGVQTTGSVAAADGNVVLNWLDESGNANNATDPDELTTFQANVINGNPVVRFDGDATSLEGSIVNASGNFTHFLVGTHNGVGGDNAFFEFSVGGINRRQFFIQQRYGSGNIFTTPLQQDMPTVWAIDHPMGTTADIFEDGASFESGYNATLANVAADTYDYVLGDDATGGNAITGDIAEIITIDGTLTAADRNVVQSYLALKYGITLNDGNFDYTCAAGPSFFPGASDADFTTFRSDVAGIGRDDQSDFQQLTSMSVNSTAVLSVTKAANFVADKQYVAWGHNGVAIAGNANSSDIPSGIESRLGRTWRLKLTNNPSGTVNLTFNLADIIADINSASDLRLLVDTDGVFLNATVLSPTVSVTGGGNLFTFENVDLSSFSDEDIITVGSISVEDSALPLDFISFFGEVDERGAVILDWQTTNEVNVNHFEIQRTYDGINFEIIGQEVALNVENAINSYRFVDQDPGIGNVFYRLEQFDFDGQSEKSDVILVEVGRSEAKVDLTISPNPSNFSDIEISYVVNSRNPIDMLIVDVSGKEVWNERFLSTEGNESGTIKLVNYTTLKTGLYIFSITQGGLTERKRFIVK